VLTFPNLHITDVDKKSDIARTMVSAVDIKLHLCYNA